MRGSDYLRVPREGIWSTTLLIGLAAAAHQGFSANLYTTASDMFPSHAVASVAGIGGMAGAIGGMLIAKIVGHVLQATGKLLCSVFDGGDGVPDCVGCDAMIVPRCSRDLHPVGILH